MKIQQMFIVATLSFAVIFGMASCKKNENIPNCRLTKSTSAFGSKSFSYNTAGKVNQIFTILSQDTSIKTLDYSGNTVTITTRKDNLIYGTELLTLNPAGRINRYEQIDPSTGRSYNEYSYAANGDLMSVTNYSGSAVSVITYTTTNGNVDSLLQPGGFTSSYTYYADQAWLDGDYIDLQQRGYFGNNFTITNKNLVRSVTEAGKTTSFSYTFDANNNISSMTTTGGGTTSVISYLHECN